MKAAPTLVPSDDVSNISEPGDTPPASPNSNRFRIVVCVLLVVTAVNIALMSVIVLKLADSKTVVQDVQSDVEDIKDSTEHLNHLAQPLRRFSVLASDMSDSVIRAFNGGLAQQVTALFCSDIKGMAGDINNIAKKIKDAFLKAGGNANDVEFAAIARVTAVIEDIASVAQGLSKPTDCPATPSSSDGQLSGSGGLLFEPAKYIVGFISDQTKIPGWKLAGQTCQQFIDGVTSITWNGSAKCYRCPETQTSIYAKVDPSYDSHTPHAQTKYSQYMDNKTNPNPQWEAAWEKKDYYAYQGSTWNGTQYVESWNLYGGYGSSWAADKCWRVSNTGKCAAVTCNMESTQNEMWDPSQQKYVKYESLSQGRVLTSPGQCWDQGGWNHVGQQCRNAAPWYDSRDSATALDCDGCGKAAGCCETRALDEVDCAWDATNAFENRYSDGGKVWYKMKEYCKVVAAL